jgi:hypothetical protein
MFLLKKKKKKRAQITSIQTKSQYLIFSHVGFIWEIYVGIGGYNKVKKPCLST